MTKIQNNFGFGHWKLDFLIYLVLGACDLVFSQFDS